MVAIRTGHDSNRLRGSQHFEMGVRLSGALGSNGRSLGGEPTRLRCPSDFSVWFSAILLAALAVMLRQEAVELVMRPRGGNV